VISKLNDGIAHVDGEPGLDDLVERLVTENALWGVTDPTDAATNAAVHVVIVPTLVDEQNTPDLSIIEAAIESIAEGLSRGDLVIVESTVPPRTCLTKLKPILETSGLDVGEFGMAFCPERTSSGRALEDITGAYPKIVGGIDEESTAVATAIYSEITTNDVLQAPDITTAEAVKVFEGLYRDVNIALANELARYTDEVGIDVNKGIELANTQPFCEIHAPGPGVGGHCIPYYPYFMLHMFDTDGPLLQTARDVNDSMPAFTVNTLESELSDKGVRLSESTVLVLGLTYRPGIKETRASPSIPISEQLSTHGASVKLVDPLLDRADKFEGELVDLPEVYETDPDAAVVVTPHDEFEAIEWDRFDPMAIIDGRQSLELPVGDHRVYVIGSGRMQ